jgi:hypothetical protein
VAPPVTSCQWPRQSPLAASLTSTSR